MSDADSECGSDVQNFPPLHSLVKNFLNVKPDRNVETSHLGNRRSKAKIKMNFSKAMDKNKPSFRGSIRGALKKQAEDFMIEIRSDLANLNENFNIFSKSVFELLENCVKLRTLALVSLPKFTELRKKIMSMDERMTEINHRMTKLEEGRYNPTSQESSLAPIYADSKSLNERDPNPTTR